VVVVVIVIDTPPPPGLCDQIAPTVLAAPPPRTTQRSSQGRNVAYGGACPCACEVLRGISAPAQIRSQPTEGSCVISRLLVNFAPYGLLLSVCSPLCSRSWLLALLCASTVARAAHVRSFRIQKEKPATHFVNGRLHQLLHSGKVPNYSRNFYAPIIGCCIVAATGPLALTFSHWDARSGSALLLFRWYASLHQLSGP